MATFGPNSGATVATLRNALAPYWGDIDLAGYLRELVEAELLPADCSAPLDTRQVVFALIALATDVHPIDAPEEVLRVADFELRFRTGERPEDACRIALPEAWAPLTFLTFVEQQIEAVRGALHGARAHTFLVGVDEVLVQIPSSSGGGMLSFLPAGLEQRPYTGLRRAIAGPVIDIAARLLGSIEQQEIAPEIMAWIAKGLDLTWLAETRH